MLDNPVILSRRERLTQVMRRVDALRKPRESAGDIMMRLALQMANESIPYLMILMVYLKVAAH
jgi:hypothetical protein